VGFTPTRLHRHFPVASNMQFFLFLTWSTPFSTNCNLHTRCGRSDLNLQGPCGQTDFHARLRLSSVIYPFGTVLEMQTGGGERGPPLDLGKETRPGDAMVKKRRKAEEQTGPVLSRRRHLARRRVADIQPNGKQNGNITCLSPDGGN
jgi:hypothetical protein